MFLLLLSILPSQTHTQPLLESPPSRTLSLCVCAGLRKVAGNLPGSLTLPKSLRQGDPHPLTSQSGSRSSPDGL